MMDKQPAPTAAQKPNDHPALSPAADAQPQPVEQLVITLFNNGNVGVQGKIDNPLLCYGLLECAKDAVRRHVDDKGSSRIQVAKAGDPWWRRPAFLGGHKPKS